MDLLSLSFTDWALVGALLLFVLYKIGTWNYDYFSSRGIKYSKPLPFLGSMASSTFKRKNFAYEMDDVYKKYKGQPFVGFFQFLEPVVVPMDPELIKKITVKDFDFFTDHQQNISSDSDELFSKNLFSLTGERWRDMRITLSPAFTSSKMKNMFSFINNCGVQLGNYLEDEIRKQEAGKPYILEMKDLFTRFANDVIATSAFGVQVDSLKEKNNYFYLMGKSVTDITGKFLIFIGLQVFPKVMKFLKISFLNEKEKRFFTDLVHETVTTREKQGIVRPDMIHLLMQARKGQLTAEKGEMEEENGLSNGTHKVRKIDLTEDDIAAQAMVFFFAGFDTASTLLSFASILLATHQNAQKKLQDEIDEVLGSDGIITYEKVQKMKYLDMVVSEALRIFPPVPVLDRECVKNYTIPATDKTPEFTIKKKQGLFIPAYSIHHDPEYYPDPEKFDPERFSDENKSNIRPYTYMPFGVGPRLCIGQRFALLEAKVALIHILSRFNLVVVDKTPLPLRLTRQSFTVAVEGDFWMGATPRQRLSS